MPLFNYQARNPKGGIQKGTVDAVNEQAAADVLRGHGLVVTSLVEEGTKLGLDTRLSAFERVHPRDIVIFARQLSTMISATLPLVQALKILTEQQKNQKFRSVLAAISSDVDGGARLSVAMEQYSDIFSNFFISVIKTGEQSGKLDETLLYLADQLEKDYELNSRIKSALYYPVFLLGGIIVVGIIMITYVIPQLKSVLVGFGDMPWSTQVLLGASDLISSYWWVFLIVIVLAGWWFNSYRKSDLGRKRLDRMKLKIPIFGKLFQQVYIVRMTRNLYTLLQGGVKIIEALEVTADVVGNTVFEEVLKKATDRVSAGDSVSTVLRKEPAIPLMVAQVIEVGEKTGKLPFALDKISEFYSRELDNAVRGLSSLLEPVIMVILGVGVGILMAAVILPIYNISSQI